MHWKALDLDPEQATSKDVKLAYAQRLKKCRPDQDPEGFRLLHDAYQTALNELEWRARTSPAPDDRPNVESPADVGAVLQQETSEPVLHEVMPVAAEEMLDVLRRLEDALISNQPGVGPLVRDAEMALFRNPDEVARWGHFIGNLITRYGKRLDLRFHPEVILFELEHGSVAAALAIIERLDQTGSSSGIDSLALHLLCHKERIRTAAGGIAASRLACAAAFWAKDCVGPLADFAYQNLARVERDFHMSLIDRHLAISSLLESVPSTHSGFWWRRLVDNSVREGWDSEPAKAALRWLNSPVGSRNAAAEVLRGLVPEDLMATTRFTVSPSPDPVGTSGRGGGRDIERDQASPASATSGGGETFSWEPKNPARRSRKVVYTPRAPVRSSPRISPRLGLLLIIPLVRILMMFGASDSSDYHSSYPSDYPAADLKKDLKLITAEELAEKLEVSPYAREKFRDALRSRENELNGRGATQEDSPSANPLLKVLEQPPAGK